MNTGSLGDDVLAKFEHGTYDIGLVVSAQGSTTLATLTYNPTKHSDFQLQNFATAFDRTLQSILANPNVLVSEVDMLSPQHHSGISEWNSSAPRAEHSCVHHLIEKTASTYPEKTAITSWDGELTYEQLNSKATRLAHHLVSVHGLGPGVKVPICFNKSIWAVVAMLAILKTGAAYCCMDPNHPQARRQFIVTALEAPVIITSPINKDLFSSQSAAQVLILSSELIESLAHVETPVINTVTPQDVCVVAFTSGSTGVPKGIVHTHTSMCTGLVENAPRQALNEPDTRVFQWSAYTFDISFTEILCTLIHGGCICSPSDEERLYDVEGSMNRMRCNWVWFTPSFSRFFRRYEVPTLETLSLGGEMLRVDDVRAWAPRAKLIHVYGPAECITTFMTYMTGEDVANTPSAASQLSFGGMSNAHGWIVDPDNHNRLLPIGAVGELLIEGPGLFSHYLGDPKRTQSVLLGDLSWRSSIGLPCSNSIYATGDLVRYTPGGGIACIGRKDAMVKLRGQRIDLGEIETVLREIGLSDSAEIAVDVVIPKDQAGHQTLVAFLRFTHMKDLSAATDYVISMAKSWQNLLRIKLPEYMVPNFYYPVPSLPYNASGKLDRNLLRKSTVDLSIQELVAASGYEEAYPQKQEPEPEVTHSLPQELSPVEALFHRLWAETLKKDEFGLEDNFFALGGSSLDVIHLVAWARDEGYLIHYTDIFGFPTLRQVAGKAIKIGQDVQRVIEPLALIPYRKRDELLQDAASQCDASEAEIEDILPLTPQQHGLWAASLLSNDSTAPGSYVAHFRIQLADQTSATRFRIAWEKVANATEFMRVRFIQTQLGSYQVVLKKTALSKWRLAHELDIDEYIQLDQRTPLDFGKTLNRYAFLEESNQIVWTSHHALYDGHSLPLFLNAVAKQYRGESWYLGPRSAPLSHFIGYLEVKKSNEDDAKEFWLRKCEADGRPVAAFPRIPYATYRPRSTGLCKTRIDFQQPRGSTITKANLLRAALSLTIARLTGASDVNYLETIDGRSSPVAGIQSMIGPTFATVPTRSRVVAQQSAESFLTQMQQSSIEMMPYSQLGLQKISQLSDACAAACEFQTLLVIEPRLSHSGWEDVFSFDDEGGGIHRFNSGCVLWKCDMDDDGIDLTASFDEHVLPVHQLHLMVHTYREIVAFLSTEDRSDTPITSILGFHPANYSSLVVTGIEGKKPINTSAARISIDIPHKAKTGDSQASPRSSNSPSSPTSAQSATSPPRFSPTSSTTSRTGSSLVTGPPSIKSSSLLEEAWLDTLSKDRSQFSPHDNFFLCGGNSLRAMELVAVARRAGISITVAQIFRNPVFENLAAVAIVRPRLREPESESLQAFSLIGSPDTRRVVLEETVSQCGVDLNQVEEIFPATQLQAEFMASLQVKPGAFMAQIRYDIPDNVSIERYQAVWEKIHQKYPIMRTRLIKHSDSNIFQVIIKEAVVWIESNDLSEYLIRDRVVPTRYGDKLSRYAIVKDPNSRPVMVWTVIHSLYDGFTLNIMHRAMTALLAGRLVQDVPSAAPFIKYLSSIDKTAQESYWRRCLADYSAKKPFPMLPSPEYSPRADAERSVNIQLPTTNSRPTITPSTIILAAYALVISHATASDDVVFGTCPSGRSAPVPGITEIMMPTVAHVLVRARIPRDQTIGRFLHELQAERSDMMAFEQVGLATLSKYGESCRAALMTFQSMLIIQNQASATISGGGDDGTPHREELSDSSLFNDRALMVYIAPDQARGTALVYCTYDSKVLAAEQIDKLARRLEYVLSGLMAEGDETTLSTFL